MPPQHDPVAVKTKKVKKKSTPVPGQTGAGSGPSPAKKPAVTRAPVTDVQSSGGDYGMKRAARAQRTKPVQVAQRAAYAAAPVKQRQMVLKNATGSLGVNVRGEHERRRQLAEDREHATAMHDILTAQDIQKRDAYEKTHPITVPKEKHGTGLLATAVSAASKVAPLVAGVAEGPIAYTGHLAVQKATGLKIQPTINKIAKNAPIDAAELAVTTPSSVAKLASTAATHPQKVPGMLAKPYVELAKHPGKAITEHPVSTALMLDPAVKLPGRVLGRVARTAGKQTLERAPKTLPGTALKQARAGSRDAVVNAVQKRRDRKAGPETMSDAEIKKRTDEFFDVGQKHTQRVVVSATKAAKRRFAHLPKDERKAAGQEHVSGARGGAKEQVNKKFVEEFGSTWTRTPEGVVIKPKAATKGVLHDSKADADAIAARVPFEASVKPVGEKYGVVPKVAADRLSRHYTVGTSPAIGAKVMRTAGKSFRGAVLPLSTKWLFGQAGEAGVRAAVARAGPVSLIREHKVFKKLEGQQPGKGVEFRQRTSGGGQFGLTSTAREFADGTRTLGQEFEGTGLAKPARAMSKAAAAPGIKHVRAGFRAYSHVVFNVVNGAIEQTAQRAMTGRALKQSPLMDHKIIGLSDKAIHDAAQGLHATENQVALGRAVDRMYGKYSKHSPETRETLLHTTPFYPWYRNVVTFLGKVLPVDHPVLTSLLASANLVEEDWRKKHGLSLLDPNHKPGFLLGSYPAKGGKVTRLARYTPFGATADPLQGVADLALPQFAGIRDNLKGLDWTGKTLKGNPILNAALTAAETHVPGVAQADRISGLGGRYVRKTGESTLLQGKDLKAALLKEVNPLMAAGAGSTESAGPAIKVTPVRVKPVRVKPIRIKPIKVR